MSKRAIIGVVESAEHGTWRGVYNGGDGYIEGAGELLVSLIDAAQGDVARVARSMVDSATPGWNLIGDTKLSRHSSPFPEGVGPGDVGKVDPLCVYLLDPAGQRLLVFECGNDERDAHAWAGLADFQLLAVVPAVPAGPRSPLRNHRAGDIAS